MKKLSISILLISLLGLVANSSATSPQPEEVRPGWKESICTINVIYSLDSEKGINRDEASSTFAFEASVPKKDVLDKMTRFIGDKLNEVNVSEFKLECKFPK